MILLIVFVFGKLCAGESIVPNVTLNSGTYLGQYSSTSNGRTGYLSFKGIKFAAVVQRFKEAVPEPSSNKTYQANQYGPACAQYNLADNTVIGEEDCLFLNVFTPNLTNSFPVIVFIYGGTFIAGATNLYTAEYFMESQNIVIVTISYRVGAFGFLYLDDPAFPANLGLRDQILALRWVQRNVKYFGGDPNRVTIAGQSAGAASVSLLMHSPMTKGLFVGAISESGSACALWAAQPRCTGIHKTRRFIKILNCSNNSTQTSSAVDCLMNKSKEEMVKAVGEFPITDKLMPFTPIVESEDVKDPVINIFPWLTINQSEELVPWLTGINNDEGLNLVSEHFPKKLAARKALEKDVSTILPALLLFENTASDPYSVTKTIINTDINGYENNFEGFITDIVSEFFMAYPMSKCLRQLSSPSYSYYFNYTLDSQIGRSKGIGHSGELKYIWTTTDDVRISGSKKDIEVSQYLVKKWTTFAYNQSPNHSDDISWNRYNHTEDKVLIIDNDGIMMGPNPYRESNKFWDGLPIENKPNISDCLKS